MELLCLLNMNNIKNNKLYNILERYFHLYFFILACCQATYLRADDSSSLAYIRNKINCSFISQNDNSNSNQNKYFSANLIDENNKKRMIAKSMLNNPNRQNNTWYSEIIEKENCIKRRKMLSYSNEKILSNEIYSLNNKGNHNFRSENNFLLERKYKIKTAARNDNSTNKFKKKENFIESRQKLNFNLFIDKISKFEKTTFSSKKLMKLSKRHTASMIDEKLIFFDGSDQSYAILETWPPCQNPVFSYKNFTFSFTFDIASANLNVATGLLVLMREMNEKKDKKENQKLIKKNAGNKGWRNECGEQFNEGKKKRYKEENDSSFYELKLVEGALKLKYRKILECDKMHTSNKNELNQKNFSQKEKQNFIKITKTNETFTQNGKLIKRFKMFQGLLVTSGGILKNEEWKRIEVRVGENQKGHWVEVVVATRLQASKSFSCEEDGDGEELIEISDIVAGRPHNFAKNDSKAAYMNDSINNGNKNLHLCKPTRFEIYLGGHKTPESNYRNNYSYKNNIISTNEIKIKQGLRDKNEEINYKNPNKLTNKLSEINRYNPYIKIDRENKETFLSNIEPTFRGFMKNINTLVHDVRDAFTRQTNNLVYVGNSVKVCLLQINNF